MRETPIPRCRPSLRAGNAESYALLLWLTQLASECYVGFGSQVSIPDGMRYLTLALKAAPGLNPGRPMVGIYCPWFTVIAMLGWLLGARTNLATNLGNNNSLFLCFCIDAVQQSTANPTLLNSCRRNPILVLYPHRWSLCSACSNLIGRTSQMGRRTNLFDFLMGLMAYTQPL